MGTIDGQGAKDTITATKDKDFTLTDASLTATDGLMLTLTSVENALLTGGASQNTFVVSGWTGMGTIIGAGDKDTISATKDHNFVLTDASLTATDGLMLNLLSIENALLTGGASQNTFIVSGWTGMGTIIGAGDKDTISATKDKDFTLADNLLTATDGLMLNLLSIENALLTGGASQNTFVVSGWTGMGTIDGQGAKDTITATKDKNFTLTDNLLTASDGLMLNLLSIENALLTGGPSANTFAVTNWTGMGKLNGQGGTDTVSVTKDKNFIASDSQIRTSDGMMLDLVSIEIINLTGGASPNRFDITPSTIATFNIDGLNPGFGDPAGGDSLFVDFTGTIGKRLKFSGPPDGIGMWTFTNRLPVNFKHIENLLNFSGNVTTKQQGNTLTLTGDGASNGLSLTQGPAGSVVVYALGGTLNGLLGTLPLSFPGVRM